MLHLRRVAQKVCYILSYSYTEVDFLQTPQNIIRAGKRSVGLRGLATAAEPYDVVVIGGGEFHECCAHETFVLTCNERTGRIRGGYQGRSARSACTSLRKISRHFSEADVLWNVDRLRGKAWCSRWNVSERRMYTLESHVEQFAPIPPSPA